jgi:predicted pyridoxine 5'-phosphate oxidase superfamily flavin-nucleotide-binding protein
MSITEKATEMHTMLVADPRVGTRTIEWNGQPEERAVAKRAFEEAMATHLFLAYATVKAPAKGKKGSKEQIRAFDPERETTWLVPRLVGG